FEHNNPGGLVEGTYSFSQIQEVLPLKGALLRNFCNTWCGTFYNFTDGFVCVTFGESQTTISFDLVTDEGEAVEGCWSGNL
ncbi:MAG: hypothetical protein AAFY36_09640, partial [Bacteroidota bacterium]